MAAPSEPLLPVEPDRPSRLKLWLLAGGIGAIAVAIVLMVVLRSGPPAATPGPQATADPSPRSPKTDPKLRAGEAPGAGAEERQAKDLFDRAEAFERAEPGEYEKRLARWREIVTTYPTSSWARKADERHRAASTSLQAFLDREFESARQNAQALSAAGHYLDAIEALRTYKAAQTRELLQRRADLEIGAIENSSRLAFNEAAAKAKELAASGNYAAAIALFESLSGRVIPEAAARCATAIAQLRTAAAAHAGHLQALKGDEARRALRQELAPLVLGLVRARQYEDALRELGAAAGSPANALVKEDVAAERASVADASSFWEAFLKTVKAKTGQDATILLADGRRISGKISRIQSDRIVMEVGEATAEAPFDKLHADLLVGWTLGKSLAAEDAVSYVKAALFFFCEGRDDLAKLYLATARELNGPVDAAESVFRAGLLRAAMPLRK